LAKYKARRQARYEFLLARRFTPLEARELSRLPGDAPALRLVVRERESRWNRWQGMARWRVGKGQWREEDVPERWLGYLARLYTKRGWRVQHGAKGKQQKMPKYSPNPWAMYRGYERQAPRKDYVSPWEVRIISRGTPSLVRGLVQAQRAEKGLAAGAVSRDMIRSWIAQKDKAISGARGTRRTQLIIERNRLERLIT